MAIHPFSIYRGSIIYLIVPILFFFMGWLKLEIGLLLSFLLLTASYLFLKKVKGIVNNENEINLSKEYIISFLILFLFLLSTGNTGFIACWGTDIPWRNAIYQDLVRQPWPVIYEYSQSMLCYYMVFWLVPAEITSLLHLNEFGGNVVLFLWMYAGLLLIFFLLCAILKPQNEQILFVTIGFLFFSGINTFGMIIKSIILEPAPLISDYPGGDSWAFADYNINGIDYRYGMRTIYLCIADVYNQFFALAIAAILFFKFRECIDFYAFIGLLTVPYSPIGFIGLFCMMTTQFFVKLLKNFNKKLKSDCLRKVFSRINLLCTVSIFPAFFLYYSSNFYAKSLGIVENNNYNNSATLLQRFNLNELILVIALLMLYYYLYFLIYARLIYNSYRNDSLYWISIICLMIFPFFKVGSWVDFNLNATITPYLILLILILKHLLSVLNARSFAVKDLVLVACLSIAMLTPLVQIATSFRASYINDSITYRWSPWSKELLSDSFRDKDAHGLRNFLAQDYADRPFYMFAKRNK